ncbi:hypothetical protein Tco_0072692 [Tanacetum coccineum]
MEVVCQEFEATSKDPEGHSVDELITEFCSCLSAKVIRRDAENNAFDATSSYLTELEANEVVNDGDMELLTNVESTSCIDARDNASELGALIHIRVNGDSVDHRTQPDGEISCEVNGDQLHEDVNGKDALVTDDNDDDSVKQNDEVESTTNDLLNSKMKSKVNKMKTGAETF